MLFKEFYSNLERDFLRKQDSTGFNLFRQMADTKLNRLNNFSDADKSDINKLIDFICNNIFEGEEEIDKNKYQGCKDKFESFIQFLFFRSLRLTNIMNNVDLNLNDLCQHYLNVQPKEKMVVKFKDASSTKTRNLVSRLIEHLSMMTTTLSTPGYIQIINEGLMHFASKDETDVLLKPEKTATSLIRMSNSNPQSIVWTINHYEKEEEKEKDEWRLRLLLNTNKCPTPVAEVAIKFKDFASDTSEQDYTFLAFKSFDRLKTYVKETCDDYCIAINFERICGGSSKADFLDKLSNPDYVKIMQHEHDKIYYEAASSPAQQLGMFGILSTPNNRGENNNNNNNINNNNSDSPGEAQYYDV
ncbi:MAG: hypothetical protein H0U71_06310 [Gammaproteobacteria bacterium]|nr:hypothetical protein [Gammaproteobacteria bacterium]